MPNHIKSMINNVDLEKDVEQAIASDTPFEQIPKDIWKQIIF